MLRHPIPMILLILLLCRMPIHIITPAIVHAYYGEPDLAQSDTTAPTEHSMNVPFYYQENTYYCGPASLQMVFDYYGENISQSEIADVARTIPGVTHGGELRRAAHFSNLSSSTGNELPETITGYTNRKLGYAASARNNLEINDLKSLISQDLPTILLMTWVPGQPYGHYRVAVGYNQTHIFMHDPWNKDIWGEDYGGPNLAMNYTFLDTMWDYSTHWGLLVTPWKISIETPHPIRADEQFQITAEITYVHHTAFPANQYAASSCIATIHLQNGLVLAEGEDTTKSLGDLQSGQIAQTEWTLVANDPGDYSFEVSAEGRISGTVPQTNDAHPTYEYQDQIGAHSPASVNISASSQNGFSRFAELAIASIVITATIVLAAAWHYRLKDKKQQTPSRPSHASFFMKS